MSELTSGILINDGNCSYELVKYIGSGSYGEVWQARDTCAGNDVAIKFYIMLDEKGRKEFFAEYETASVLKHDNLLTALYVGEWEGRPFLVMPFCAQGTSSKFVGQLTPSVENERLVWQFIHDVASGLAHLHGVEPDPIVHQDIKPDNILIDDAGHFVITDFGISVKIRSTMRSQSMRTVKAGAVAYMGPERFAERPISVMASDIWSLGASIYELITGELPFCGMGGGMQNHGAELPSLGEGWSDKLNDIVRTCLAKNTWDRIKAYELADYAGDVLSGKSVSTVGPKNSNKTVSINKAPEINTVPDTKQASVKKSRTWIWLSAAASVLLLLIVFSESPEHKYARVSKQDYADLVSDCIARTSTGNNSDYDDLLTAKDLLSDIKGYEYACSEFYPEFYNESGALENTLNAKLQAAGSAWAKAADSQYTIGNETRALEYYRLADRLYSTKSIKSKLVKISESKGYMRISDMSFSNRNSEGEIISDYGLSLTASAIQYLGGRVKYEGLMNKDTTTVFNVKIYTPNGNLMSGSSSPAGYTYSQNVTVRSGHDNFLYLLGWGNSDTGVYSKGTYRWEIWHKNKRIYTHKVTLN